LFVKQDFPTVLSNGITFELVLWVFFLCISYNGIAKLVSMSDIEKKSNNALSSLSFSKLLFCCQLSGLARALMSYKHFACTVSYRTGLSLRKITEDYLEVLLELGLLKRNDNTLVLGEAES
jgi:hypothetical protein